MLLRMRRRSSSQMRFMSVGTMASSLLSASAPSLSRICSTLSHELRYEVTPNEETLKHTEIVVLLSAFVFIQLYGLRFALLALYQPTNYKHIRFPSHLTGILYATQCSEACIVVNGIFTNTFLLSCRTDKSTQPGH